MESISKSQQSKDVPVNFVYWVQKVGIVPKAAKKTDIVGTDSIIMKSYFSRPDMAQNFFDALRVSADTNKVLLRTQNGRATIWKQSGSKAML